MNSPKCSLRFLSQSGQVVLRVTGRATLQQSPGIRRFAEKCRHQGAHAFLIDLRNCTHMDSTFVGTLLFLQRKSESDPQFEFGLVAPAPACQRLLEQMGVADVLPVVPFEEPANASWTDLPSLAEDMGQIKSSVIQAHQELAKLPGESGEQFRAVAACLAAEEKTKTETK